MRTLTVLALVLALPALAAGQTPAVAQQFLVVPGQGIGPVHLGMTIAEVRAVLGHEVRVTDSGFTRAAVFTWNTQGPGRFGVWFANGRASYIAVNLDPRYATAQGLRAGDPADKVRQIMGAPLDVVPLPGLTLGRLEVLRYPGILFYIPAGAPNPALNGKVYSIIVSTGAQATPPVQPTPPAQTQPTQPAPAQPPQPAPAPVAPPPQPAPLEPPAPAVPVAPAGPTTPPPVGSVPAAPIQPAPGNPAVIVPGRSIGAVKLGMRLAEITGLFGDSTDTLRLPDGSVTQWWLNASKQQGFGVRVTSDQVVNRLYIKNDARYVTDTGLHVGSVEPEIRRALGRPTKVDIDAKSHIEILRYDQPGLWFEIQLDRQSPAYATVIQIDVMAPAGPATLPAAPAQTSLLENNGTY